MKKIFLLFLVYSFNIVKSSDNSNKLSTSPVPQEPTPEFLWRVKNKPADRDEIVPSAEKIASLNNFYKTVNDFINGKNEYKTTISSFNSDHEKTIRIITIRHDNTPMIVTYTLTNVYKNPRFKEISIWTRVKESIVDDIKDIIDTSNETVFSNEEINKIELILNAKITACFPPQESDSEQDLIPAPAPMKKNPSRTTRSSESYRSAIPETPPSTQYRGQPYYPKEFINEPSPDPINPNSLPEPKNPNSLKE